MKRKLPGLLRCGSEVPQHHFCCILQSKLITGPVQIKGDEDRLDHLLRGAAKNLCPGAICQTGCGNLFISFKANSQNWNCSMEGIPHFKKLDSYPNDLGSNWVFPVCILINNQCLCAFTNMRYHYPSQSFPV